MGLDLTDAYWDGRKTWESPGAETFGIGSAMLQSGTDSVSLTSDTIGRVAGKADRNIHRAGRSGRDFGRRHRGLSAVGFGAFAGFFR
jgi:hypothetical protein